MTLDQLCWAMWRIHEAGADTSSAYRGCAGLSVSGVNADPARHFLPVEAVKGHIDCMAHYKFNTLQLHLSDDQGWRIEIKSHPKLTEVGAFRNPKAPQSVPTMVTTRSSNQETGGVCSPAQRRDYSRNRRARHTAAILTAYPDLRCDFLKDSLSYSENGIM